DACRQESGQLDSEVVGGFEFIAGDLPLDESVVGQVLIEGLDNGVAIMIGRGAIVIVLEAVRFGKTRQVEPVSGTASRIVRSKQSALMTMSSVPSLAESLGMCGLREWLLSLTSKLALLWPGTLAGPASPPLMRPPRSFMSSSGAMFLPPWQRRHFCSRRGLTC